MSVKDIEARIDELSAEIERQKNILDQLERSRKVAYRQLNAIRDPVARLPLEISSEIFLQCLSLSPRPPADPRVAPMLLLNICNAWTNIALSNPALWAAVCMRYPCDELLQIWLQRARGYPLAVTLEGELDKEVGVLGQYSKQLKHLEVYADFDHDDDDGSDIDEKPQLSSLIAIGPFSSLETLEIGSFRGSISITQIIRLLRLAPNLVEFTLCNVSTHLDRNGNEIAVLPNIHSLKFGATTDLYQQNSHDDLLEYITLPDLKAIFLSLDLIYHSDFSLFLERSSPPLQKLGLGPGCYQLAFSELAPCLRLVPSLVHLELCMEPIFLVDFFLTFGRSPSDFLPNLHTLKIRYNDELNPSEAVYQAILRALPSRRAQLRNFDLRGDRVGVLPPEVCTAFCQLEADGTKIYIGTNDCNFLNIHFGMS